MHTSATSANQVAAAGQTPSGEGESVKHPQSPTKRSSSKSHSERGSVITEMVYTIGLFFFILTSSFESLKVLYAHMMAEFTTASVMRGAVGIDLLNANTNPLTRAGLLQTEIAALMSGYGVSTSPSAVSICPVSNVVNDQCAGQISSAGKPNELIRISVDTDVWIFFHTMRYRLHTTVLSRNEPT